MENLIKKIEQYQAQNKITYDAAMAKPFNEIVFELAGLIGNLQAQLAMVKNELQNGKYIQLEKEFEEYKNKINSEWLIPFGNGLLIDNAMYLEIDFELKECGFNLTWDIFMYRFYNFNVFNAITESDVFLENLIIKVKQSVKYITYKNI